MSNFIWIKLHPWYRFKEHKRPAASLQRAFTKKTQLRLVLGLSAPPRKGKQLKTPYARYASVVRLSLRKEFVQDGNDFPCEGRQPRFGLRHVLIWVDRRDQPDQCAVRALPREGVPEVYTADGGGALRLRIGLKTLRSARLR